MTDDNMAYVRECHRCPRKRLDGTTLRCDIDGAPCLDHAERRECPDGRYAIVAFNTRPAGAVPGGYDGDYRRDSRGSEGCNCA